MAKNKRSSDIIGVATGEDGKLVPIVEEKKYKGRIIKTEKRFNVSGTFESLYAAEKFLSTNGYSYGSLCRNEPVAIRKGEYDLTQKWKNFTKDDEAAIDGVMVSYDFRNGEVVVYLFN